MQRKGRLGRGATVAGALGAAIGFIWIVASATHRVGEREGAAVLQIASLGVDQARDIRSVGGPATFGSLETVCTQIAQSVSRELLRSGDDGASTKELQRLMKGMRCVE